MSESKTQWEPTPIAVEAIALIAFVAIPAAGAGLVYGGLGPWAVAAAGGVLAFIVQTHRLASMKAYVRARSGDLPPEITQ
ncbi:Uncharacterised protein [Mycobacteroides abscessus subsp. abscessus]|uniref:hypothetical protein n=1 Tax=Mycobacteroides abscessus TaxID=36809 RepID=UPI0009260729|nr:hypothetical protein [Mycobacteroides abscessus]SHX98094.1 Uncharacterised protein [Mycobacteroides abscessus subsp. abscessus]SIC79514.1 Uncharacterised protein [Mycobacteroides abscessus subsp. abscessus]SKK32923.1 Uncharacterised protein [Mycobacteroides abscessus subsp. abscessus]SKP26599.1 Uncharacterised protein [Mycobacteroides abscessus subsp. abscessus]